MPNTHSSMRDKAGCVPLLGALVALLLAEPCQTQSPTALQVSSYHNPLHFSHAYKIEASPDGGATWLDAHALEYCLLSEMPGYAYGAYPWVHWATLEFAGEARIRVTRLNPSLHFGPSWNWRTAITSATLLPASSGVVSTFTVNGGTDSYGMIEFTMKSGQNLCITTNGTNGPWTDTVYLFSIPPDDVAAGTTSLPNVEFVPAGNLAWQASNGTATPHIPLQRTIYLDHGAWVTGCLDITDSGGGAPVTISGPGVICGSFATNQDARNQGWPAQSRYSLIHTNHASTVEQKQSVFVEGITMIGSPFYNFWLSRVKGHKRFSHVHMLSPWTANTDGFQVGGNVAIHDCFSFLNDDQVHMENTTESSISVIDSVFAGRSAFLAGYGYASAHRGMAQVAGCSVIFQWMDPNPAVLYARFVPFRCQCDGDPSLNIVIENQIYKHITVEGNVDCLFSVNVEPVGWTNTLAHAGKIKGLRFEDITLTGAQARASEVQVKQTPTPGAGAEAGTAEYPIVFKNVTINSTLPGVVQFAINGNAHVIFDNLKIGSTTITAANASPYIYVGTATGAVVTYR